MHIVCPEKKNKSIVIFIALETEKRLQNALKKLELLKAAKTHS